MANENFTTYTETDALNRLTQTVPRSTFTGLDRGDTNILLWKDYGVGFFDDWVAGFKFELRITSMGNDGGRLLAGVVVVTDGLNDWLALRGASVDQLGVVVLTEAGDTNTEFELQLRESFAGGDEMVTLGTDFEVGTTYYCKFTKNGASASLFVYSDSDFLILIDSDTLVLDADHTFRYILVPQSSDFSANPALSGWVQNLDFQLGGWSGTIAGVTDPAAIAGVDVADIAAVKGFA